MTKVSIMGLSKKWSISAHPKWTFNIQLKTWFQKRMKGYTLHVPCGKTRFPNAINVDLDPNSVADIIADMFHLPFKSNTFDTIISDPPYKLAYDKRAKWVRELLRVVKKEHGSRILLKLDFIPYFGPQWDLKELVVYQGKRYWAHVSLLLHYQFVNENLGR